MDRKLHQIACLLVLLLVAQSVLAGNLHSCMNNGDTGHEQHDMMLTDNIDVNSDNTTPQPACDCGYYCVGTCVHACQVFPLVTSLESVYIPVIEKPASLLNSLFVTGFGSVPFRPPIYS